MKTQTYAKSVGERQFNWTKFLAKSKKDITEREWQRAEDLAGSWPTCACGNQCAIIPRSAAGIPNDEELFNNGVRFSCAISDRSLIRARATFARIEARSAQLIAEIRAKNAQEAVR